MFRWKILFFGVDICGVFSDLAWVHKLYTSCTLLWPFDFLLSWFPPILTPSHKVPASVLWVLLRRNKFFQQHPTQMEKPSTHSLLSFFPTWESPAIGSAPCSVTLGDPVVAEWYHKKWVILSTYSFWQLLFNKFSFFLRPVLDHMVTCHLHKRYLSVYKARKTYIQLIWKVCFVGISLKKSQELK